MDEYLQIMSVPIIVSLVYLIIEVIKSSLKDSEKFKRYIPIIAAILGGTLGILCFYFASTLIPADNVIVALFIGIVSGLSATGTNQIFKQINKN